VTERKKTKGQRAEGEDESKKEIVQAHDVSAVPSVREVRWPKGDEG